MSDPKAVLAEYGMDVPDGMDVNVVENSDNTVQHHNAHGTSTDTMSFPMKNSVPLRGVTPVDPGCNIVTPWTVVLIELIEPLKGSTI